MQVSEAVYICWKS